MPQTLQIKRRIGGAAGAPATLAAGELSYNSVNSELFIGADAAGTVARLVSPTRQVELANDQTVQGVKTFTGTGKVKTTIAGIEISGGTAGQFLSTVNPATGALAFADVTNTFALDADMDAATPSTTLLVNPQNVRSLIGGQTNSLTTLAATIIPAINELKAAIDLLVVGSEFVGTFQATASTITWVTGTGAGNALPAASIANKGWYLICDEGGAVPPAGAPAGTYLTNDWLISSGTVWTQLNLGATSSAVPASGVAVTPPVAGGSNVQTALEGLDTNKVERSGDVMLGVLVLAADPVAVLEAATKQYVDAQRDTRVAVAGDTMTGPLVLPLDPVLPLEAATKQYVDAEIAAIVTTVTTDGISIIGDGTAALPLAVDLIDCGIY